MKNKKDKSSMALKPMLHEALCDDKLNTHLKHIGRLLDNSFHRICVEEINDGFELKFRTIDDCVASELAMKNNGNWLDCYTNRILVRKGFISCFVGTFVSDDELPKPTYQAIENLSEQTGDFAKDFVGAIKDGGSVYAEAIRNSIIERFGTTIAYLNESIIATDMRIVKHLLENGLTEAKHFT